MNDLGAIRTALFVPGNRPDRVDKAVNTQADVVVIDLEDAVPISQKEEARAKARDKLLEHGDRTILVRVNSLDSGLLQGDLREVLVNPLRCIILPKVECAGHIQEASQLLLQVEKERGVQGGTVAMIPLIESGLAVQNISQILGERTIPPRLLTVAFGAADYALDLGIELSKDGSELFYARSRIPIACRAARTNPPLDTPFMIDLKDMDAFKADALRAKQLGFQGKLCIHPDQIAPCNAIFSPTEDEILRAQQVIQAFEKAETEGIAAIQLDGRFIDYAVVERARRVLRLAAIMARD